MSKVPKRPEGLLLDLPADEQDALAIGGVRLEPQGSEASNSGRRSKYSPGAVMEVTKSWVTGLARTPSRTAAAHSGGGTGATGHTLDRTRASVNPINRAASDAKYITSRQQQDQKGDLSKLQPPSSQEGKSGKDVPRTIKFNPRGESQNGNYSTNRVITSKYNVLTFLPIFLFEMFSRVAYLYFLLQAALSWWSVVSPFGGIGSTAALLFVLVVAGVKAIWEDVKRHQEDKRMNTSVTHRVNPDGSVTDIPWTDVKVGDAILVRDEELFPSDLICLYSALADKVCFIKTTNLDGETNLKIRKPLDLKGVSLANLSGVMGLDVELIAESPNRNLHKFKGKALIKNPEYASMPLSPGSTEMLWQLRDSNQSDQPNIEVPVTMNEMLLRGCMLKNSNYIVGLVVYTGKETRIQMNAAKTPLKVGSFDRFLNLQIALVILMQLGMCLFCAIANYVWQKKEGTHHYYLALDVNVQGIYANAVAQICINFLTFWILLSYLVPISLFVTLEIVKFWQGFIFINFDTDMRDPKTQEYARCRNSNLNEDLGKVEYIFSDKTGTLTSNEMQLREIAIKGVAYGSSEFRLEDHTNLKALAALKRFDARLYKAAAKVQQSSAWSGLITAGGSRSDMLKHHTSYPDMQSVSSLGISDEDTGRGASGGEGEDAGEGKGHDWESGTTALGHHLVDFWTNICLCQSLILEHNPAGGAAMYQGPSPDEVALVEAARQMGFEFKKRAQSQISLSMLGEDVVYDVLNVMEYSSERGCMSVIARSPDGTIRLYCKGSDAKVMKKMRSDTPEDLVQKTEENLHFFAKQGLRTLVLGTKIISEHEYNDWDVRYQVAAASFADRDASTDVLCTEVERDLELVGVTAIEDKLQEGVPAAISTMLSAGIRVWMITGDKQETAVNIAVSCHLVGNPDDVMMLNVDERAEDASDQARAKLLDFLQATLALYQADEKGQALPAQGDLAAHVAALPDAWQRMELAVDGPTLTFILADDVMKHQLAVLAAHCSGVVVSRSSPSQKAAIVKMMTEFEMWRAAGTKFGLSRWYARYKRRMQGKMLSIGDGANDVAMLQTADVGIGIMGKEGRQAVNNSDYAIAQFRFLVPLLLIHGNLSYYRLARLIKYSFYKNITFAFILFYYQFYCGFSGQALVDSITAAVFNVVFTSFPILLFAILDRPVKNLKAFIRFPQLYNKRHSRTLTTLSFWKTGVLLAIVHGAICFFVPYYSLSTSGSHNITDVYSLGKIAFVALLGTVTLEVALVARYWTWLFTIFTLLSYLLVYPFMAIFPLAELGFGYYDPANIGVANEVLASPIFWLAILICYILTFGIRYAERTADWVFKPHDTMILAEKERKDGLMEDLSAPTRKRLAELGMLVRRASRTSSMHSDLERGGSEPSLAEMGSLRQQYSASSGNGGLSPSMSGAGTAAAAADGLQPDAAVYQPGGGAGGPMSRSAQVAPEESLDAWHSLQPVGSRSQVRFASHARSASGTTYPLN